MDKREDELRRARQEYERRDANAVFSQMWSPLNPGVSLLLQSRERVVMQALRSLPVPLDRARLADVGCGTGVELARLLLMGFDPGNCAGIDLSAYRVERARRLLPAGVELCVGSADDTPWADDAFDLVTQFTLMSSVLDSEVRAAIAREMVRICAPGGTILWYDMRRDYPKGRRRWPSVELEGKLHWFAREEIIALFPGCTVSVGSATLDPLIGDRLAARSRILYEIADLAPWLHSHNLVVVRLPSLAPLTPHAKGPSA